MFVRANTFATRNQNKACRGNSNHQSCKRIGHLLTALCSVAALQGGSAALVSELQLQDVSLRRVVFRRQSHRCTRYDHAQPNPKQLLPQSLGQKPHCSEDTSILDLEEGPQISNALEVVLTLCTRPTVKDQPKANHENLGPLQNRTT